MNLFGMTLEQLQAFCLNEGLKPFVAKQICDWLYAKRVSTFDEMTNLSRQVRSLLTSKTEITHYNPIFVQTSTDGTKKYLFDMAPSELSDAHRYVEAVIIPDGERTTLCLSCQRGCRMGCKFCVTGQQGFHGNLTVGQMLSQVLLLPESHTLTNIVFMGMGEPMDNLDNILNTIKIITSEWGLGWSPHRITVSSVGIIPGIRQFLDQCQCHLAVSLHNPFPEERKTIMPMQSAYPLNEVIKLLHDYDWSGQRRISFEYTMFKGKNDDLNHAAELVKILHGLPCRVNLIRYHSSPDAPFCTSNKETILRFQEYLNKHGVRCTLRASRGEDIMAACGLLAGQKIDN